MRAAGPLTLWVDLSDDVAVLVADEPLAVAGEDGDLRVWLEHLVAVIRAAAAAQLTTVRLLHLHKQQQEQ